MDDAGIPSSKQQSWGAVLSIIIILMMVVVGAYYAWNKRAADERALESITPSESDTGATSEISAQTATSTL